MATASSAASSALPMTAFVQLDSGRTVMIERAGADVALGRSVVLRSSAWFGFTSRYAVQVIER